MRAQVGHWKITTFVAALGVREFAVLVFDGPRDDPSFCAYVE
jgi:hypothetical protein